MSRYLGPKLRIVRRLGLFPGLTRKVSYKENPPGEHGEKQQKQNKKKDLPQYTKRLQEKQKLRYHYGISERQLLNYVRRARKSKGSTGELLLQFLEMRLDTIIFRLGLAPTILAARQIVNHGHILVNQTSVNIPSYICKKQDRIKFKNPSKATWTPILVQFDLKLYPQAFPEHPYTQQQLQEKNFWLD